MVPLGIIWDTFVASRIPLVPDRFYSITLSSPISAAYRSIEVRTHWRGPAIPHPPPPSPDQITIALARSDATIRLLLVDPTNLKPQKARRADKSSDCAAYLHTKFSRRSDRSSNLR
jgi:hypothetical protein